MPTSRIHEETKLKPREQRALMARVRDRMNELGYGIAEMFGSPETPTSPATTGRANISRTAWYSYESGRRPVDMEVLRELERVLRFPAGELLKMAGFLPSGVEDFAREPGAVLVALEVDPELTAEQKDSLRTIYQGFVEHPKRRRRPSPTVH